MNILSTSNTQIRVNVFTITRGNEKTGCVSGWKENLLRAQCSTGWSVYFRNGEPVPFDGANRPHPKLVMAAARAAWMNF